jgi:hypothetical protein
MELNERKRQKRLQSSDAIVANNTPSELPTAAAAVEANVPDVHSQRAHIQSMLPSEPFEKVRNIEQFCTTLQQELESESTSRVQQCPPRAA